MEKKSRAITLMLVGAVLLLASIAVPSSLSISATNPLTFDFDTSTNPWVLNLSGGNAATFTWINSNPNDPHVRLTCSAYKDTGWVGAVYWFDNTALSVGESYTVSFWYLSDSTFNAQYISQDSSWHIVNQYYLKCPASPSWKYMELNVPNIEAASHYCLSFNLYNAGNVNFDLVKVTPNTTPTATPTPSPIPSVNSARVTLMGDGGGITMTYLGEIETCSSLAANAFYIPTGTTGKFYATPNQGNEFSHWEVNGNILYTNPIEVTVNENTVVTAVFTTMQPTPEPEPTNNWVLLLQITGAILIAVGLYEWFKIKKA